MKKNIQLISIVALIIFTITSYAQQPPNFKAANAAGIVTYDIDKVIKKLKVEDKSQSDEITKSIHTYNVNIDQLAVEHAETFQELDAYFNRQVQIAMQRRDRSQMDGVKSKISETIPPIRKETTEHETQLNNSLEVILDEKQYKKWISYQRSQKPSLPAGMGN